MTQFWMKALQTQSGTRQRVRFGLRVHSVYRLARRCKQRPRRHHHPIRHHDTPIRWCVYALNADFRLNMPQQLQDAINHGTPVSFSSGNSNQSPALVLVKRKFSIHQPRTTHFVQQPPRGTASIPASISTATTRSTKPCSMSPASSQWRVLWPNQYSAGEPLEGSVRITNLNTSRLPRTYQLNSLTNKVGA